MSGAYGETDLAAILKTLTVTQRPDRYTLVSLPDPVPIGDGVAAVIQETEGTTVVATLAAAEAHEWPVDFVAAWLTIDVHTSLEGVGLTAALSTALAAEGISCNILAGWFHDHLLVPHDRAAEAIATVEALAR